MSRVRKTTAWATRRAIEPPSPEARGHSAEGFGFFVWYATRAEAEGWRRELALDELTPRAAPQPEAPDPQEGGSRAPA